MREARIHVRHIRDLLRSVDPADAYAGVDCNSVSFLNIVTVGDILGKLLWRLHLSRSTSKPTKCHVHPVKTQIGQGIPPV